MSAKLGRDYLRKAASNQEMVKQLREAKTQRKSGGQQIIFHKFIKEVFPTYKFYKVHAELTKQLQRVIDGDCKRLIIQIPPRHGKLASHCTPVLTPNGWTTHGKLRPGDIVFHPSGRQIRVLALSEEMQTNAKVFLGNGETIECHLDHEWTVYDRGQHKWRTVETRELVEWSSLEKDRARYQLPDVQAVQFEEKELPMDPYVFGVWLGDGKTNGNVFCGAECDSVIADEIESRGYKITKRYQQESTGVLYYILDGLRTGGNGRFSRELKATGARKEKHIPEVYLRSSVKQRLALLAGLIDTDGSVCPESGRVRIVTASKRLADDIMDVCSTLGFRPYLTSQKPSTSTSGIQGRSDVYTVGFQPNLLIPCILERKKTKKYGARRRVGILSACTVKEGKPGRCIQVSSPDGLYLVGKKLIPTHNSLLASRLLPAAYLLAHPDRFVGITSYSAELAEGFSRNARDMYKQAGGVLDPYKQSVNDWATQGGGGLWAAGVGGAITGRSGHLLIVDDPVKNREDAESPRLMEKLRDWYTSTLYTRLEPGVGSIVVIQTRWSENDLIGQLIESEMNVSEKGRENWTILDLPAISEDGDDRPTLPEHCPIIPDWREEAGIALCPQRYDIDDLERIREAIGSRDFASLYQQRPAPEGGNMFNPEWWQYWNHDTVMPEFQRIMLSVDCTFTNAKNSDYVVGMIVGQAGNQFYVLDMAREKVDVVGTMAMISRMYKRHALSGTVIELAASGYAVYQMMSKKVPGLIGFKPEKSKEARASGIVPLVEAGNIFLPASAPWLDQFINEFSLFPASKNDDMVDALTMAVNYMSQRAVPKLTEVTWGRGSRLLN